MFGFIYDRNRRNPPAASLKALAASGRQSAVPVIDIGALSLTFQTTDGPVHALSDIDLSVMPGDFVPCIGPFGCGKTTLMRVIADNFNAGTFYDRSLHCIGTVSILRR